MLVGRLAGFIINSVCKIKPNRVSFAFGGPAWGASRMARRERGGGIGSLRLAFIDYIECVAWLQHATNH